MIDKIEKLLKSNVYGDIYIGLKLLNDQPKGKIPIILKNTGFHRRNKHITWSFDTKQTIQDIPEEAERQYIEGKYYYYSIGENCIMIDNKTDYKWTEKEFKRDSSSFKIIETWK